MPSQGSESQMREILETFEQILEIMPDDRDTLEAAEQAAMQCGDGEKVLKYRLKLAEVVSAAGDQAAMAGLVERLRELDDPRAREWVTAHEGSDAAETAPAQPPVITPPKATAPDLSASAINDEIDLAWKLFEDNLISQQDYSTLVQDLTESSSRNEGDTVSVLHALEATHHKDLDQIIAKLSESSRLPYLSMGTFTIRPELLPLLDLSFVRRRGALVFEVLSQDLLVAILNPFSKQLRQDVETLTGRRCHFFLTKASEFDVAVNQLIENSL